MCAVRKKPETSLVVLPPAATAASLASVAATAAKLDRADLLGGIAAKHYLGKMTSAWRGSTPATIAVGAPEGVGSDPADVATWVSTWVDHMLRLAATEMELATGAVAPAQVAGLLEGPFLEAAGEAAR